MKRMNSTKKIVTSLASIAVFAILAAPSPSPAMNMQNMQSGGNNSMMNMQNMRSGGNNNAMSSMQMQGNAVMLPGSTVAGITAMGHLKDIRSAMQKRNMPQTHHFMIMLTDAKTGKPVDKGAAALKITDPTGATGKPIKLMAMTGGFGSDVTLDKPGAYTFTVGTRLADGKKRSFTFHYTLR